MKPFDWQIIAKDGEAQMRNFKNEAFDNRNARFYARRNASDGQRHSL